MSTKKQPAQLETSDTHNGKNHKVLVEKVRPVKHDPAPLKSAHADRAAKTGDSKY